MRLCSSIKISLKLPYLFILKSVIFLFFYIYLYEVRKKQSSLLFLSLFKYQENYHFYFLRLFFLFSLIIDVNVLYFLFLILYSVHNINLLLSWLYTTCIVYCRYLSMYVLHQSDYDIYYFICSFIYKITHMLT